MNPGQVKYGLSAPASLPAPHGERRRPVWVTKWTCTLHPFDLRMWILLRYPEQMVLTPLAFQVQTSEWDRVAPAWYNAQAYVSIHFANKIYLSHCIWLKCLSFWS
ncbi:hypothetical protein FKM82_020670 [Ascaphus truei]